MRRRKSFAHQWHTWLAAQAPQSVRSLNVCAQLPPRQAFLNIREWDA